MEPNMTIKEAIKQIEDFVSVLAIHSGQTIYKNKDLYKYQKASKIALDILRAYSKCSSILPKKKYDSSDPEIPFNNNSEEGFIEGYNQAIEDCTMVVMHWDEE